MDVYEAINSRKTIRDFSHEKVPFDTIKKLIQAGLRAPSNNHLRQWDFIVIQDKKNLLALSQLIQAPTSLSETTELVESWHLTNSIQKDMYIEGISKQYSMIRDAQFVIVPTFLADSNFLSPSGISSLNCFASIWCCVESILIAAAGEGIYGVMRIPINRTEEENAKNFFNLPEKNFIPCFLAMGYPHENAKSAKQIKFEVEDKIHLNRW